MSIQARYSGVCPDCGERWQPGDLIRACGHPNANGLPCLHHVACPDAAIDALMAPARPGEVACPKCWLVQGPQGPVDTVTRQPGPHAFLVLLHKAQDQLATYSAAAIRAGVDKALVEIATVQASAVLDLARRMGEEARRDLSRPLDEILLDLIGGHR